MRILSIVLILLTGIITGCNDKALKDIISSDPDSDEHIIPQKNYTPVTSFVRFKHLGVREGLSSNTVYDIEQDNLGFMWFATLDGLNRYDGYEIKVYRNIPGDTTSLPANQVSCMKIDKNGFIWLGFRGKGIACFDPLTNKCTRFVHSENDTFSLADDDVRDICMDEEGRLWIATGGSLHEYDYTKRNFKRIKTNGDDPSNLFALYPSGNKIYIGVHWNPRDGYYWYDKVSGSFSRVKFQPGSLTDYSSVSIVMTGDTLWIGSRNGLNKIDPSTGKATLYYPDPANVNSLSGNDLFLGGLLSDSKNRLWIGTFSSGVNIYNKEKNTFTRIVHDPDITGSLSSNLVREIYEDRSGIIWIATSGGGLNIYDPYYNQFTVSKHITGNNNSPASNRPVALRITSGNKLWISYSTGGADCWDRNTNEFIHIHPGINNMPPQPVHDIIEDSSGIILFGHFGNLVHSYDPSTGKITATNMGSYWNNCFYRTTDDHLFIGSNGSGLHEYDGSGNPVGTYSASQDSSGRNLSHNYVTCIAEEENGNLLIGTYKGLNVLNRNTGEIKIHQFDEKNNSGISGDFIYNISVSHSGEVYIANDKGLDKWNGTSFERIDSLGNFAINNVISVSEDADKNLWLTTTTGLLFYDVQMKKSRLYDLSDGLPDLELGSPVIFDDGTFCFASAEGLVEFNPLQLRSNPSPPELALTGLSILNVNYQKVNKLIAEKKLELTHEQYFFSVQFAALDFHSPGKNEYAYLLEGFNQEWISLGNKREVTFTNLDPGNYSLYVKGSNNSGVWSDKIFLLEINVLPPWWQTWWFRTAIVLSLFLLIVFVFRWRTTSLRKRKEELESTVILRTKELREQKQEVEIQKELVEEKQKEILDSINYAKRIQQALLAHDEFLKEHLEEHFVYFQPKDIVSGDFYWATHATGTQAGQKGKFYLAVCDSTGHGVPGAFMSLLNISYLNEAINEKNIFSPAEVLNHVRKRLIESISSDQSLNRRTKNNTHDPNSEILSHVSNMKDGMDATLICFDHDAGTVSYAAAHNPPVLVRNGECMVLEADKMPVGIGERMDSFSLFEIKVQKGDMLYFHTDGFADQFGGEKGKKLKSANLKKIFTGMHSEKSHRQNELLKLTFDNWKGSLEQIDDVCIIGIRI
jgi:ligand-binding sensor domain-containing protein